MGTVGVEPGAQTGEDARRRGVDRRLGGAHSVGGGDPQPALADAVVAVEQNKPTPGLDGVRQGCQPQAETGRPIEVCQRAGPLLGGERAEGLQHPGAAQVTGRIVAGRAAPGFATRVFGVGLGRIEDSAAAVTPGADR